MKALIAFALAFAGAVAGEPDAWRPHDHPAVIERAITGFTAPARQLVLASEVGGVLEVVNYEAGQQVPGEMGARAVAFAVDDGRAVIAREQAAAAVAEAEAAVAALEAQAAVAGRERDHLITEHERLADVGVAGGVADRDLAAAKFAVDSANLGMEALKAGIARAAAGVAVARKAAAGAADHLARHEVVAPNGWVVEARLAEPGAMLRPGQPVLRLVDVGELAVHLHLGGGEIAALGETVELTFPDHPDRTATARVHHVGRVHDPRSFKRPVELRLVGKDAPVASGGLEVRFTLRLPDPGKVLVPVPFLDLRLEQAYVLTGEGRLLPVTPLRRQNGHVVVAAATLPDDVVLARPEKD